MWPYISDEVPSTTATPWRGLLLPDPCVAGQLTNLLTPEIPSRLNGISALAIPAFVVVVEGPISSMFKSDNKSYSDHADV